MLGDAVNGLFETIGAVCIFANIRALLRDKQVRGVYWPATAFFWAWGIWNLWFYPSLGQWFSFAGGLLICACNFVWLALALTYSRGQ
jgi:hypothetical protein